MRLYATELNITKLDPATIRDPAVWDVTMRRDATYLCNTLLNNATKQNGTTLHKT